MSGMGTSPLSNAVWLAHGSSGQARAFLFASN